MVPEGGRVVIVGASAAGLRCACRLARIRPDIDVTVLEQSRVFSYAACGLPYALSGDVEGPEALRRTLDGALRDEDYFAAVKRARVLAGWRVIALDAGARTITAQDPEGGERPFEYDELVLATGARPRRLPGQPEHPRVRSFHTIDDLGPLHQGLASGRIGRVALVGAGLVGCELAEAFRSLWGCDVTLIEAAPHPLPAVLDAELGSAVGGALREAGVSLLLGCPAEAIEADDQAVVVHAGGSRVEADIALIAVGVVPCAELARGAGAELGPCGGVLVDDRLASTVEHVWAAGDCVECAHAVTGRPVHLPLGSLANRQGRALANVLAGRDDRFPAPVGAVAVKVFDTNVAATGLTLAVARATGLSAEAVWTLADDRAHYWPEAREIAIQLVYEKGTRRLLGVQAVGPGEVVKRIDVASQLLARAARLDDVAHLEHAYAPPYAPAVDPLAVAAFVASNQEDGVVSLSPAASLEGVRLLDVRHDEERAARPMAGSVSGVALETLRAGPCPDADVVVCERGARSAEAVRVLAADHGRPRYLGGGLKLRELIGLGRRP